MNRLIRPLILMLLGLFAVVSLAFSCRIVRHSWRRYKLETLAFEIVLRKTPNLMVMDGDNNTAPVWVAKRAKSFADAMMIERRKR